MGGPIVGGANAIERRGKPRRPRHGKLNDRSVPTRSKAVAENNLH